MKTQAPGRYCRYTAQEELQPWESHENHEERYRSLQWMTSDGKISKVYDSPEEPLKKSLTRPLKRLPRFFRRPSGNPKAHIQTSNIPLNLATLELSQSPVEPNTRPLSLCASLQKQPIRRLRVSTRYGHHWLNLSQPNNDLILNLGPLKFKTITCESPTTQSYNFLVRKKKPKITKGTPDNNIFE